MNAPHFFGSLFTAETRRLFNISLNPITVYPLSYPYYTLLTCFCQGLLYVYIWNISGIIHMERLCAYNPRINHILHLSYEIREKTMTTKNTLCFTAAAVIVAFILGGIFLCRQGKGNYAISPQNNVRLPVIMYHSVLKDTSRTGDYIITPDSLEEDMAYLEKNGYTAVSAQQVLDYCKNNGSLPDKPVMITFDDGFLNNLTYALPILEKYHMKGIVNIVGSYCESAVEQDDHNPYYQYLTWKEISALSADGTVEIGAHTYSMHSLDGRKGCSRLEWESVDDYQSLFSEDLSAVTDLLRENCGISPRCFRLSIWLYIRGKLSYIVRIRI